MKLADRLAQRRKPPVILQSELSECGLACLAMIACYHGRKIDLISLRREFPVSLRGVNLQTLMLIADKMGLASRPVKVPEGQAGNLRLPCVLHWEFNHFVVLVRASGGRYLVHCPARGELRLRDAEFNRSFTGIAVELTPSAMFSKVGAVSRVSFRDLLRQAVGLRSATVQMLVLSLVLLVFNVASPLYIQGVLDDVLVTGDRGLLGLLAAVFLVIALFKAASFFLREHALIYISHVFSHQMSAGLFRHLLSLPLTYFEKRTVGDIHTKFAATEQIRRTLTDGVAASIVDGVMSIAMLALMCAYSPAMTAVVCAFVAVLVGARVATVNVYRLYLKTYFIQLGREKSLFLETVRAMQSVKLLGLEAERMTTWQGAHGDVVNASLRLSRYGMLSNVGATLCTGVEVVVVVFIGARLVLDGRMTAGALVAFVAYRTQFVANALSLADKLIHFLGVDIYLQQVGDIALHTADARDTLAPRDTPVQGALTLEGIKYRFHPTEPPVFDGVSFTANAGESVAIVGPSGSGKTTLLKIMTGLLPAESGTILVDGWQLGRQLGMDEYRAAVAAVMQDDVLLSGSIEDNITFFEGTPDLARMVECAKLVGIHRDIDAMPMRYKTLVSDMGSTLSGGQKQRIFLARALYRRPRILFLDEATSHLDVDLERQVNTAIKALNMTRIIIAHRPETIRSADRVLRLERGQLVAEAPMDQTETA